MRGQSEVIGVAFLTAVIVILVGFVGFNVLTTLDTTSTKTTNLDAEVGGTALTLHHQGGESLAASETDAIFSDGGRTRLDLTDFTEVQGDGDARFEAGESWRHSHNKTDSIRILVVHDDESDTIVLDTKRDVP